MKIKAFYIILLLLPVLASAQHDHFTPNYGHYEFYNAKIDTLYIPVIKDTSKVFHNELDSSKPFGIFQGKLIYHTDYWHFVEGATVDLSNYYTKIQSDSLYLPSSYVPDYNNLLNKPVISTDAATLNGHAGSYYLNYANFMGTPDLSVYALNSSLSNYALQSALANYYTQSQSDARYLPSNWLPTWGKIINQPDFATVAYSGVYGDLSGLPTIPAAQVNSDWNASTGVAQILNKPTIPTNTNQLTNGANFITSSALSGYETISAANAAFQPIGAYATASNTMTFTNKSGAISQWTNDANYLTAITSSQVTTALGFTPYNSTNPNNYISGITSSMINTALGYTAANGANYLPLSGGTLTGNVTAANLSGTNTGDQDLSGLLVKANNLSDLASASTARTNLGLGTAAIQNIAYFLQSANNLSDLSNAATARTNLGLGSAATSNTTAFEVPLTFTTGLNRSTNTITNNLSTGVNGGQTIYGGTASGDALILTSTSNTTKGKIYLGSSQTSYFDEANNILNVTGSLQVQKSGATTESGGLQISTDALNSGVTALYILPPANSRRIFLGKSGQGAYSLNFSYVSSIESFPSFGTTDGTTWGNYATYIGIGRSGDALYYNANYSTDGRHIFSTQNIERMRINEAGNIGIGTASPNAAAIVDITSTTKGFLPPRMTTTQRNAISSPAAWLTIICTDCTATDGSTGVMQVYNSSLSTWKNAW